MQQSFNVFPSYPTNGNEQENGSSEDAPPLPPLPPMQWRINKIQIGSSPLSAKIGRPPRPKPPAKQQESEAAQILHETNQLLNMDFHENRHQEGDEYHAQDSDPFPSSEVECLA